MDNKQIIEEIDIIVRAKVEQARDDMKKLSKETNKMVSSMTSDLQKINNNGQLDGLKKTVNEFQKEIRKVKINDNNFNISYTLDADTSDIDKIYADYENKFNEQLQETKKLHMEIDSEKAIESLKEVGVEASELQENINNFDALTLKDEIKTIGMQIAELIPQVKSFSQELKQAFTEPDRLITQLGQRVKEFGVGISYIKGQASQAFEPLKQKMSDIQVKLAPINSIFSNIGKVAKNGIIQATANFKELTSSIDNPIGKIRQLISKIRESGNETEKAKKKGKTFGTDFGKSIEKGVGSIKKFAMSLLGVRTAFSMVSKAAQSYLSFDTQLSDSIQNSWNVLGSLLAPTLEYVASLFSKLVSGVAMFVKSLTGIDLVARANAKALDKQAKSAKNANQLSGNMDEITNINDNSGKDETGSLLTVEDVDISPLEKMTTKAQEIFSKLFDPFKKAWDKVGKGVIDSFLKMLNNIKLLGIEVFSSIGEVWSNGTGQSIIENALLLWQSIFDIVGGVSEALSLAWSNAGNGTSIIQSIADIFKDIQLFSLDILDSIKQWVISESFQEALNRIIGFMADILKKVKEICDWLLSMYEKYLKPVIDEKLLPAIDDIVIALSDIWNAIQPGVDFVIACIENVLEPAIQGLCQFIGGIIDIIRGIAQFISGVFTGDWKKAWNGLKLIVVGIWDSIWGVIRGILNMMIAGFENFINFAINGLNKLLKPLRDMGNAVLDFLGVKSVKIPQISNVKLPRLKSGHVAKEPLVAEVGEYPNARSDPEIISPISMMRETFVEALQSVLPTFQHNDSEKDFVLNINGREFARATYDDYQNEGNRRGTSASIRRA